MAPVVVQRLAIEATRPDYEPELAEFFRSTLAERAGAFIDVGANVGQTLLALLSIDRDRTYVGFEPQIEACAEVARLISSNGLPRHQVLPCALGEVNGVLTLHFGYESDVRASFVEEFRPSSTLPRSRQILVRRGDDVLRDLEIDDVALIKIDVEGAELEVLRGLRGTIEAKSPTLTFEVLPDRLVADGSALPLSVIEERRTRYSATAALLAEVDYQVFRLSRSGPVEAEVAPDPSGRVINLVAIPADHR